MLSITRGAESSAAVSATTAAETENSNERDERERSAYLGSYSLIDEEFGTEVTATVEGGTRTIEANALPNHKTGEFPNVGNPNAISEQDLDYSYTTNPQFTGEATPVRTTGVSINGVKFEPGTAETVTCDAGEEYRVEALQDVYNLGLDFNNAHVQPTGEYHYHGVSHLMVKAFQSKKDLVHVGFAADGYLIYASKSGAYEPGYELSTAARTGTGCVGSTALDPELVPETLDGSTPDGTYASDYVFDESAGDLDECNGTTINGEYAYVITNSYPFVGRCLKGEVTEAPPGQN
ncbi:MAG: YHYH protein [Phycicoccus sp.]